MKRFTTVLAVAVLAGAVYVATAPGGQTAGPTARQFRSLRQQVARLQKDERRVKTLAIATAELLTVCMAKAAPIDQFGDTQNNPATFGYSYTDPNVNGGNPYFRTGLDFAPNDSEALWVTGGTSACGTALNASLRKVGRLAGIRAPSAVPLR